MMVCLISINSGFAQKYHRRLPDKPLKLETIDEASNNFPVKDAEANPTQSALCTNGVNISRCKSVSDTGPSLRNGVKLSSSYLLNGNYIGASVFSTSKYVDGKFKRSISFK